MARLTTHVLDTARGLPACGMRIELYSGAGERRLLASTATNGDGRCDAPLGEGGELRPDQPLGGGAAQAREAVIDGDDQVTLADQKSLDGGVGEPAHALGLELVMAALAHVDRTTKSFDVRKAKRDPEAVSLSGGNLQKFVVGREILREPGILIVSQPTWGVDAGAAAVIRQALIDLAARGTAVLVISQDLDELAEIADRIAVMFHGKLSAPLEAAAVTREKLGLLMGGASAAKEDGEHEAKYAVGA